MFTDSVDGFEFPPNPAVDNVEAIRRAAQVFHIMNEWANLYVPFSDGELTAEEVVERFNDQLAPIGVAYKVEMQLDVEFMLQMLEAYADLQARLVQADLNAEKEN